MQIYATNTNRQTGKLTNKKTDAERGDEDHSIGWPRNMEQVLFLAQDSPNIAQFSHLLRVFIAMSYTFLLEPKASLEVIQVYIKVVHY